MFGFKIFVRVETFWRAPPVRPFNFCHPACAKNAYLAILGGSTPNGKHHLKFPFWLFEPLPKDNYLKELWLVPAHAILAILLCPSVSVHAEFCSVAAVVSRAAAAASPRLPPGGARCTGRLPRARPDPQIREIRELAGRSSTHQLAIWTKRPEKLLRINSWVCPMSLRA